MPVYPCGPCTFCSTVTEGHWLVEVDRVPDDHQALGGITCDGRWRLLVALCPEHRELLARAGSTGRVHGTSGVRWWFQQRS
jgi:hypothetical protein